ncbi:MAG: pilin [bacterium]
MLNFLIKTAYATTYTPLAQVPVLGTSINVGGATDLGNYLQKIFAIGIGVAAGLAVIMIVVGGIEYMSTDAIGGKEEGKDRITSALWGLLLALTSWLILNTINPALLNMNLKVDPVVTQGAGVSSSVGVAGDNSSNPSYVGGGSGGSGGDGSSVADYATSGKGFPSSSGLTNEQALDLVNQSGIMDVPLSDEDKAKYFPDGNVTAQGYVNLLAGIANSESGFNPNDNIDHSQGTDVGNTYSEGLYSLSTGDSAVKKLGYDSDAALADPTNSTQAALAILKNQIQSTGSIAGNSSNHYWGPLYRQQ